jgi:hypothetical protein
VSGLSQPTWAGNNWYKSLTKIISYGILKENKGGTTKMTNKEILEKAFNKVYKNGFYCDRCPKYLKKLFINFNNLDEAKTIIIFEIFSLRFAQTFWGEERIKIKLIEINQQEFINFGGIVWDEWANCGGLNWKGEAWKYHLQQMVLEEDPLKYLEKFLKD